MGFDYRDGSENASGTDTNTFTPGSDGDISSLTNHDEGDVFVVLPEEEPSKTINAVDRWLLT